MKSTIESLTQTELIRRDCQSTLEATLLGQALVASSLAPEDGLFIHKQLKGAIQAFVMDGEMHCLYIFTPLQSTQGEVNWQIFRKEMDLLDDSGIRVLRYVGIEPAMVNKM